MKLEIFNNYSNDILEILDSDNPVMGVLIVDNAVEEVAVGSDVIELQDYFGISEENVLDRR